MVKIVRAYLLINKKPLEKIKFQIKIELYPKSFVSKFGVQFIGCKFRTFHERGTFTITPLESLRLSIL